MTGTATASLKTRARRAIIAAEKVETIAAMLDQLQATAENAGAHVTIEAPDGSLAGQIRIEIDLSGIFEKSRPEAVRPDSPVRKEAPPPAAPVAKTPPPPEPRTPAPPPDPTPRAGHPANMGAPWTDEDNEALLAQPGSGIPMREVAHRLRRTEPSCWQQLSKLQKQVRSPKRPEPAPPAEKPPQQSITPPNAGALSTADARVALRLWSLPKTSCWTPARDLQLVDDLTKGRALSGIAADLGVEREQAIERYRMLCPAGGLEEQVQVLRALRHNVTEQSSEETEDE